MQLRFAALVFAFSLSAIGFAQKEKAFEPEFVSVFYRLRPSGEIVELERQTPNETPKGSRVLLTIPGEKSPVRFRADEEIRFVVRVAEDFDKAAATLQLFHFEATHGMRQFLVKKEDLLSNKATLKLDAERYGGSSLKVVPSQMLAPGEYCLSRSTIAQGFCFGVDATGNQ